MHRGGSKLWMAGQIMFYTYVIESLTHPTQRYIGHTEDLRQRLAAHNAGQCKHTSKFVPWKIKVYVAFETIMSAGTLIRPPVGRIDPATRLL